MNASSARCTTRCARWVTCRQSESTDAGRPCRSSHLSCVHRSATVSRSTRLLEASQLSGLPMQLDCSIRRAAKKRESGALPLRRPEKGRKPVAHDHAAPQLSPLCPAPLSRRTAPRVPRPQKIIRMPPRWWHPNLLREGPEEGTEGPPRASRILLFSTVLSASPLSRRTAPHVSRSRDT
jgi:hypothetical protein